MRRFYLVRHQDITGVSGTGRVGEGVEFSDGTVVMHWMTAVSSIVLYKSIGDVHLIHGHDGATDVAWVD